MALHQIITEGALRLRRLPWLHRPVRWLRRTVWRALIEGWIQFGRYFWENSSGFGPPLKKFSIYQALRTGYPTIKGRIILEDQGSPVVRHDSMLATGGYGQYAEQPWPILWSQHANARLVAESLGLLLEDKHLCIESAYGHHRLPNDPASRFFRLPPPVRLTGNWTSIVSRWVPSKPRVPPYTYPNYTHWLLDALPRLAVLNEFPADTRIIVPANLHPNQAECLALLGLRERCRSTPEHHLQVDQYYFSSPTTMLQGYNPYGIRFLRNAFLPLRDKSVKAGKRIFLRRMGLSREPQNIVEVEKLFEDKGWTTVDIMQLNFAQQVQVFHEAEAIAGMFGSAFTNCVFCQKGCEVMSIMPIECGLDGFLDWISQVVGYNWQPLVIPGNYDFRFSVDLGLLQKWFNSEAPR